MKKLQWAAGIILSLAVMAAWLITSFEIAMYSDFSVYEREYEKYQVLGELDMTMEDVMYVTEEMMAYLRGNRDTLSVITQVDGQRQDFFNEQDRFHMGEVRDMFLGGLTIRRISLLAVLACLLVLAVTKADLRKVLCRSWQIAFGIVGAFTLCLGVAAAADFNAVFVKFHHIFFDNDLWLFDPAQDYMIRMLPEGLFADMVLRIGVLFGGGILLLLAVTLLAYRRKKA